MEDVLRDRLYGALVGEGSAVMMEEMFVQVNHLPYYKAVTPYGFVRHDGGIAYSLTPDKREASWFSAEKAREVAERFSEPAHGRREWPH